MSTTIRLALRALMVVLLVAVLAPQGWAFYPYGFFDQNGELVIIKWPLSVLDVNGDGDVSGPGDGLELNIETGNGADGFSSNEVAKVMAGYEEWEHVGTSYIAFRQGPAIIDPIEISAGNAAVDAFNLVLFESEDDITEQGGSYFSGGTLALTLVANTFEDTYITVGDSTFPVSGGKFIDVDTVVSYVAREIENTSDEISLQGLMTLVGGTSIGLDYSPLANFDDNATQQLQDQDKFVNVEDRVIAIRNFNGTLGLRGVTSSMFNDFVVYQEENDTLTDSHADLAPDDIAGVTYLYPRSSLDLFFDLDQRARTQARDGFASEPLAGAWIKAWCDADNDPSTARVPFTDTFTGLYQWQVNTDFRGHFSLKNLFKQLENIQEVPFTANYTFSCSEFMPLILSQEDYDSTHGGALFESPDAPSGQSGFGFDSGFPSEVFFEGENLFGLQNVNQGTPLSYDLSRRKIVSETSGKTLDVLLAAGRPMFGDQNAVCPLNVIVAGMYPVQSPSILRSFRDNVLLNTAVGTAMVDAYYRAAPTMAQYLLEHRTVLAGARYVARGFEWVIAHAEWLLALVTAMLVWGLGRRYWLRRKAVSVSSLLVIGALAFGVQPAHALLLPYDISDYTAKSSDVIYGDVTTVESYWTDNNTQIVTDVTVCVKTAIKGQQNEGGLVHFQLPTGRVGAVGRFSPDLPNFKRGEEIVLFLQCQERGFVIMGGVAGKYAVKTDPRTGKKYVLPTSIPGKTRLEKEARRIRDEKTAGTHDTPAKADAPVRAIVPLDDFVKHLRRLEQKQSESPKKA